MKMQQQHQFAYREQYTNQDMMMPSRQATFQGDEDSFDCDMTDTEENTAEALSQRQSNYQNYTTNYNNQRQSNFQKHETNSNILNEADKENENQNLVQQQQYSYKASKKSVNKENNPIKLDGFSEQLSHQLNLLQQHQDRENQILFEKTTANAQKIQKKKVQQQLSLQLKSKMSGLPSQSFEKAYADRSRQILQERQQNSQYGSQQQQQQLFKNTEDNLEIYSYQENELQNNNQITVEDLLINPNDVEIKKAGPHLFERLNKEAKIIQQNKEDLAQIIDKEKMKECTFNPKIQPNGDGKRSINQFLKDQQKFNNQKSEKNQMMKYFLEQQKMNEHTGKPKVNKEINSKLLPTTKNEKPVYERLYSLNKKKQNKNTDDLDSQDSSFRPQINQKSKLILRQGKIQDNLYNDAKRRQEKQQEIISNQEVQYKQQSQMSTKIISEKSEQMVASKFIKEFEVALNEIVGEKPEPAIDYMQLGEIMKSLRFLHIENNCDNPGINKERGMLYDIFQLLKGEEIGGITRRNLCQFCLSLIGVTSLNLNPDYSEIIQKQTYRNNSQNDNQREFNPSSDNEFYDRLKQIKEVANGDKYQVGSFDDNYNWMITQEEAVQLQQTFDMLYRNRLNRKDQNFKQSSLATIKNPTFQPNINENSKELATQYRQKLLQETASLIENKQLDVKVPANGKITHVDLLVYQKQAQKTSHQLIKREIEDQDVRNCPFAPQILGNGSQMSYRGGMSRSESQQEFSTQSMMKSKSGVQKAKELYKLAKPHSQKQDKPSSQIEYEKQCDECTFQPDCRASKTFKNKISNSINIQSQSSIMTSNLKIKNVEKSIERIKLGRERRELETQMKQRGYSNATKKQLDQNYSNIQHLHLVNMRQQLTAEDDYEEDEEDEQQLYQEQQQYQQKQLQQQQGYSEQINFAQQQENTEIQENVSVLGESTEDMQQYDQMQQQQQQQQQYLSQEEQRFQQEQLYQQMENNSNEQNGNYQNFQQEQQKQQMLQQQQIEESLQTTGTIDNRAPLLFVDVNLGPNNSERIIVFEGDTPIELAQRFAIEHQLDEQMQERLQNLLESQISGILTRIEEEDGHGYSDEGEN